MGDAPKLQWIDVKKTLGGRAVLRGVDLDVAAGRSLVVIGGSGSGKSVTLKCALGVIKPDDGAILVDGENLAALHGRERRRALAKFGMLFQGGALFDSMTIWENIAFRLLYAERVPRRTSPSAIRWSSQGACKSAPAWRAPSSPSPTSSSSTSRPLGSIRSPRTRSMI
jgi:phospholipid/cholesterol/gamma-HCH transport system ATP-binding protein